jgi:transposase
MQGKVMPEPSAMPAVYVGIDVCKEWLDVYVHPLGRRLRVGNDRVGLRRLKGVLAGLAVELVVLEATGKYHRQGQRTLHAAGLAVAVINPLRARLFAEAMGELAKTDAIDARLLALLGEALKPAAMAPPSEALEALKELVGARTSASDEHTALANRAGTIADRFLKAELRRRLAHLERHIGRLEAEIERRVAADPDLSRRRAVLTSIPGIGAITALALLAGLDELGQCSGKQAAMLVGLAPLACDSGGHVGRRAIRGGRADVRKAIYMAALSASRYNPDLASFANRLRRAGKPPKLVLVAVMRKLIVLANSLITENRLWTPIHP